MIGILINRISPVSEIIASARMQMKALDSEFQPLLIVMCTGNVCRSPMAEALFVNCLKEAGLFAQVISRGLAAPLGRKPHEFAVRACRSHGVSIDRSKQAESITGAEMAMATAVFVMDSAHRKEVERRYPTSVGKTFLLGHWQAEEIQDPINEPYEKFELAWAQIHAGTRSWIGKLREAGVIRRHFLS